MRALCILFVALLWACGSKDEAEPAANPAGNPTAAEHPNAEVQKLAQEVAPTAEQVPIAEDFADQAEQEITEENYGDELTKLAATIEADLTGEEETEE